MRKYAAHSIALILAVASFVAVASGCSKVQSKGSNDSTQTSAQTSQSSTASSQDQSSQDVEGCVVKGESAYYIQPATGDPVKVSSSGQDVSSNVGQHVRATGTASSSAPSSAGAGTSGSQSASGKSGSMSGSSSSNEPEFVVTKVSVVEATCPPEMKKKGSAQNPNPNPPK